MSNSNGQSIYKLAPDPVWEQYGFPVNATDAASKMATNLPGTQASPSTGTSMDAVTALTVMPRSLSTSSVSSAPQLLEAACKTSAPSSDSPLP